MMQQGHFQDALRYLGHAYAIGGKVTKGIGLGRKLGYPTANIDYDPQKLLPREGVYSCNVQVGPDRNRRFRGMMFIGRNYFNPEERISVEANLFDFDEDLYGEDLLVCPTKFLRPNQRFETTDDLVAQIKKDKEEVLQIFSQEN